VHALDHRGTQLWAINLLVMTAVAVGLLATIFPDVLWELGPLRLNGRHTPQVFFGLIILIILFNLYILEQQRALRGARDELFRRLVRAEAAEKLSMIDPVTEIFSRDYMDQILSREAARAARLKTSLTLLVIDINGFKSVNSRYGQLVGDRLLNGVGQLLLVTFRRSDSIIRYGGDDFLVLLPETDEQQAERAVERLLGKVDGWNRENSLPGYRLSLSCGLATYTQGANITELLDAANQRMNFHKAAHSGSR
jgi:diguanylate cyclase (GGDEF)-like protein